MNFLDWIDRHQTAENPMIPASTVVLIRDGADGVETLMMRRSSRASFAEGAWVFPGGGIDPGDGDDDRWNLTPGERAEVDTIIGG